MTRTEDASATGVDGFQPETFRPSLTGRRRSRTLLLVACIAGVAVTVPIVATEVDVQWVGVAVSLAVAGVLAVVSARPPGDAERWVERMGPLVLAGAILVLVLSTGGAASPYEVLYIPLLGFVAAFRERRYFLLLLAVAVVLTLLPNLLDPDAGLLVEALVSGAVALTLVVVHRIASSLRDANQLYLSVLENHRGPTYLIDANGVMQWINPAGQALLGMSLDDTVGLPWPELVAPGEPERLMPNFLAALEGTPQDITVETDTPGGRYLLEGTIFPVNRYGRNVAVMGITQDVTELRAAAFSARALQWVLDSMTQPVAIFDATTRACLYANQAASQMTRSGRPTPQLEWDALQSALVDDLPEPGDSRQVSLDVATPHGPRQLEVSIEHLQSDRDLVVYTAVDVTERHRRERELERLAELEHETVERLREVDRIKNAFLSAISHELRTPATVIAGVATSLQRLESLDADTRQKLEGALVRHADRLIQLLEDLLDLDRLTAGTSRHQCEPFDLVELTTRIVARGDHQNPVRIDAPDRLDVRSDRVQIERMIENLLSNAAKYAPGAPVTVSIEPRDDHGFRLAVTDQGPGIPEEDLERVFESFYRVDLDHPQPGTGIGLALVAEFAAIHGGTARAERVGAEGGTRVVVEVPGQRDVAAEDPVRPGGG